MKWPFLLFTIYVFSITPTPGGQEDWAEFQTSDHRLEISLWQGGQRRQNGLRVRRGGHTRGRSRVQGPRGYLRSWGRLHSRDPDQKVGPVCWKRNPQCPGMQLSKEKYHGGPVVTIEVVGSSLIDYNFEYFLLLPNPWWLVYISTILAIYRDCEYSWGDCPVLYWAILASIGRFSSILLADIYRLNWVLTSPLFSPISFLSTKSHVSLTNISIVLLKY